MPIVVTCPKCPTKLSAPDNAAGKAVRCPKCGAAAPVPALIPAEEVPVVDAALSTPKTQPKPEPKPEPKPQPKPQPKQASKPALDTTKTTTTCCIACNSMICVIGEITDGLIHCPKCGFANPVRDQPGESEEDTEDEKPRKKKRRDEDDEAEKEAPRKKKKKKYADDDDDDDDQPKRKRRPNSGGGAGGTMIAVCVIGGLVLLVGVGIAIYMFSGKGSPFAKKAPVPQGWQQHSYPESGIKMYLPNKPNEMTIPVNGFQFGGAGFGKGGFQTNADLQDAESLSVYAANADRNSVRTEVVVIRYRKEVPASVRDKIKNPKRMNDGNWQSTRWLGRDAAEEIRNDGVARILYFDKYILAARISGPNGQRAKPEEEAGFFDNFELTK